MRDSVSIVDLPLRTQAKICGFNADEAHAETRFREIGFAEGDIVEVLHVGLFGRSPLNIRLHGTSIAMRPNEAKMIMVQPLQGTS
jgi:ferrous iron transport protein A